jgi:hypothetical protein
MQISVKPKPVKRVPLAHQLLHARGSGDFSAVERLSAQILDVTPDDDSVRRALARTLVALKRGDEALTQWRALLAQDGNDFEAAFHVAEGERKAGQGIDAAIEAAAPTAGPFRDNLAAVIRDPVAERHPPQDIRHVAICGVSFCGSTFMDRLLGGLPGARSIGESHWLTKARYGHKDYHLIDFSAAEQMPMAYCSVCGPSCKYLSYEFRRDLAADHTDWYQRIAQRLETRLLISADKNLPKLIENDPLLRCDALVMFKSPKQAWLSQLTKLPAGKDGAYYLAECERYAGKWASAYRSFIEHLRPRGKVVFFCFDAFPQAPHQSIEALCSALELPFDEAVLSETRPGHAIGGNRGAMASLRAEDYRVKIAALPAPDFPPEQHHVIDNHDGMQQVFATMKAEHDRMIGA